MIIAVIWMSAAITKRFSDKSYFVLNTTALLFATADAAWGLVHNKSVPCAPWGMNGDPRFVLPHDGARSHLACAVCGAQYAAGKPEGVPLGPLLGLCGDDCAGGGRPLDGDHLHRDGTGRVYSRKGEYAAKHDRLCPVCAAVCRDAARQHQGTKTLAVLCDLRAAGLRDEFTVCLPRAAVLLHGVFAHFDRHGADEGIPAA